MLHLKLRVQLERDVENWNGTGRELPPQPEPWARPREGASCTGPEAKGQRDDYLQLSEGKL